ncbi:MAG: sulfide/dihydroorotate dehydrogenase-like FAD/NAD-binding protein [Clostridiales bacterium]|nr:sulfide/dihydroorotate dehydrogenase-like FAD/NAD-binding protein [Clostridiales bacterium]
MYKIVEIKKLNDFVKSMVIEAPYVARRCQPGQFVIIRSHDDSERVPLTIADYDRENETITIVYQELGYSTKRLSTKKVGESLEDVAGPLGVKAPVGDAKRVLGIGGGVGIAPLYPQVKNLSSLGATVHTILGGRTSDLVIMEDMFKDYSSVTVATDDGSKGIKGTVVDAMKDLINREKFDRIIAIGPVPMMHAVVDMAKKENIPTTVSLNPIMIDGTGMCGGCRVTVGGEVKFACVDGPDFDGFLVDFEELSRRQNMYREFEQKYDREHPCHIGLEE